MNMSTNPSTRRVARRGVEPLRPPWAADNFLQQCAHCGECVRACPQEVLEKDKRGRPFLNTENGECNFCQACVRVCGTGALSFDAVKQPRVVS
jgi:ferredoxin-type protein NapF